MNKGMPASYFIFCLAECTGGLKPSSNKLPNLKFCTQLSIGQAIGCGGTLFLVKEHWRTSG